jgi:hypothetical protein
MSGVVIEVSARKFSIPFECPCCGAAADADLEIPATRTGKQVARETTRALDFPYCRRCIDHVTAWESAGVASAGVMLLGIIAAIVVAIAVMIVLGVVMFIVAIPLAWMVRTSNRAKAKARCGPSCAAPGKAVTYLGWTGNVSSFAFESPTYAARFAEHNTKVLINVSAQLERLLEAHRVARLAVPTPAAAHMVVPPPPNTREWIARIEAQTGPIARRNTLSHALEVIHDSSDRKLLVQAASRVELAAVLAKVERLASAGAKKTVLLRAIEEIRWDNIPDELQEAELRQLEGRLRDLS